MNRTRLSSTEIAILKGIANGMPSKEIAVLIKRSVGAVEANVRTLFAKFDARSRAHLIARSFCLRIISCDDVVSDESQ
jgi:DNA-binding CsgD family transcriptional regulator